MGLCLFVSALTIHSLLLQPLGPLAALWEGTTVASVGGSCSKRELWSVVSIINISGHLEDTEHEKK